MDRGVRVVAVVSNGAPCISIFVDVGQIGPGAVLVDAVVGNIGLAGGPVGVGVVTVAFGFGEAVSVVVGGVEAFAVVGAYCVG